MISNFIFAAFIVIAFSISIATIIRFRYKYIEYLGIKGTILYNLITNSNTKQSRKVYYTAVILAISLIISLAVMISMRRIDKETQYQSTKVIICALMLDEHQYVDEWIQYNKFLGFDFIQIYDNTLNGSDYLKQLPNRYHDFVRVEHYPGGGAQLKIYQKCIDKYKEQKLWAAFIDNDEFIVLKKHQNIKHFIFDEGSKGSSLVLSWMFFGLNNKTHYENELVLKRFTERANFPNFAGKNINYLPDLLEIGVHRSKLKNHAKIRYIRWEDVASIYHYYTRSAEEFIHKRRRGRAFLAGWDKNYTDIESLTSNLYDSLKKHRLTMNHTLIQDTRALDFFLKHKKMMQNNFDCPLINYTLSCAIP